MRIVADSSVLAAVAFKEPGFEALEARLAGAAIHAPVLLKFELAQVAVTKSKRFPANSAGFLGMLEATLNPSRRIRWHDVNPVDVALIARATGLSAYDASYLWLAGWLEADLLTLDKKLAAAQGLATEVQA